jgi:hypothetical protein
MKFWIYVICFLPTIILDALIREHVSFSGVVYSFFPNGSLDDVALLSGLLAAATEILLWSPAFYISKKWIAHREGKEESRIEKILAKIPRLIGIALVILVLSAVLILILLTDSVWFAGFITTFCDVLIVVGFVMTLSSVFISQKHKDIIKILRLSGSSLFVIGLTIFYLYTKLHM